MAPSSSEASAQIEHCCQLLRSPNSDEERFVGLLLASKLVGEPAQLRRVCHAALPFVRRLLTSPPPAEAVEGSNPYRSLTLSVLSSFVADHECLMRRDLLQCAIAAGAMALHPEAQASEQELRDSATVLDAALRQPAGLAEAVRVRLLSSVLSRKAPTAGPQPQPEDSSHADAGLRAAQAPSTRTEIASALLIGTSNLICASVDTPLGQEILSLTTPRALWSEFLATAARLASALAVSRDAATISRLSSLLAVLRAADASRKSIDEVPPAQSGDPLCVALRAGLGSLLSSKVQPAVRADVLCAASVALRLLGPLWLLGPSPLRRPSQRAPELDAHALASGSCSDQSDSSPPGEGALLSLLVQLATVEWCMCLHDQPDNCISEHVLVLLPSCCAILEEALFRFHADVGATEQESSTSAGQAMVSPMCWLDAVSDEELMSAQRAFQAVVKAGLDYVEAVRTESAERARGATSQHGNPPSSAEPVHPLLLPVARLLVAWLVQPSACASMELYDRANAVLPTLRAASRAESEPAAWVRELRNFERVSASDLGIAQQLPPNTAPPTDETMADMFARLMGTGAPQDVDSLRRALEKQRTGA
mmetsp:Transcript_12520/g.38246  ORF Transcript_12520/g.38246 Transcript_12520/m.38246 type:complete len:595 (+) Transcript_12520:26-1810(+)